MSFEPRAYQSDAVKAVMDAYTNGQRQLLLRLPTGAGKTVISAFIIEALLDIIGQGRILFLAHRKEIIDQTAEKIGKLIGAAQVSIEQADRKVCPNSRVVIASVQTLAGRLEEFPAASFHALIVDECHHAYAKSWMDTISHFGKQENTLLLGLTATSKRSDGRCVSELFQQTVFEISLGELQEQGFLVPMDYSTVEASLGLGNSSLDSSGDFQGSLLGKIMNSPELRSLTIRAWLERAADKKTIAFCASIKHAEDLTQDLLQMGIAAAYVSGQSADRDEIIQAFRRGEIRVLSNFGVLTEGFDDPSIECVLLARPTTSPLVYSQCLGRGLRTHPGKTSCTVIDIVDRQQHQLQYNAYEAAGLKRSWRGSGRDPLREAEAIARIRVTDPGAFLKIKQALSLDETQKILMNLDPRIVLAGIDGMPLVRYQSLPAGQVLATERAVAVAERIFQDAGLSPTAWEVSEKSVKASLFEGDQPRVSPYLAWHVNQATGLALATTFESRLPPSLPEPEPIPVLAIPPPVVAEIKPQLGLKARLEKMFKEEKTATAQEKTLPPPVAKDSAHVKSIQDKLRAIKEQAALRGR